MMMAIGSQRWELAGHLRDTSFARSTLSGDLASTGWVTSCEQIRPSSRKPLRQPQSGAPLMRVTQCLLAAAAASSLFACDRNTDSPSSPSSGAPDLAAGFVTTQDPQAFGLSGSTVKPIITVGDPIPGQEANPDLEQRVWAPIPDGLGAFRNGSELVLFANHEIASTGVNGRFTFARVSRLVLDRATVSVKSGSYALTGKAPGPLLQRLCSATFNGPAEGFSPGWFFTGEESTTGGAEGIQTAVRADGSEVRKLPGLGRMAHENYISVPGFRGKAVMIGTDDTSPSGGLLHSELYMYLANSAAGVLSGSGTLYVFHSSSTPNSGSLQPGVSITGNFAPIEGAATLTAAELEARVTAPPISAFKFVRLEDVDYARGEQGQVEQDGDFQGSGRKPAIYFVDTGNAAAVCGGAPCDLAGSIYRMEFDPANPTENAQLVLLARSPGAGTELAPHWASPDNIALSENSLMLQEDPAYAGFARAPRIWNFKVRGNGTLGAPKAVVVLDDPACVDPNCWESSGIINTSEWLGKGTWLFDIQAHTKPVPSQGLLAENGQLLYLRTPGS
jgi:hypothetical protein